MNAIKNECEKVDTPMIAKWSGIEIKCLNYVVRDIASALQVGLGTVSKGNLFQQHKSWENPQYNIIFMKEYQNDIKTV
jgi:hypothetical protein